MAELYSIIKHFMLDSASQVKFHRHVMKVDNIDKGQAGVLEHIDELYQLFPEKTSITEAELKTYIAHKFPSRDPSFTNDIITSAFAADIGPEITKSLIEAFIEKQMAAKSLGLGAPYVSNQKSGGWRSALNEVIHEYDDLIDMSDRTDQLQDCDISYQEAMEFRATDSGIRWPIDILNKCMGGVEPNLGLIIARSDTGKTSFILNCLAYFAYQLKGTNQQLLYCGNEEGTIGLKARCGVSLLGVTTEWAENNTRAFGEQVTKKNGDCIRYHGGMRNVRDVEVLLKRYKPLVIVADQIAKFKIPGSKLEGPAGLAETYGWFRDKAKEYNTLVLGVAQADAKAHNQQWLSDIHINASKTDVPGELDFGIGIGFLIEAGMENIRFMNIFKNKQKYGRKGRGQVNFDAERCRYYD